MPVVGQLFRHAHFEPGCDEVKNPRRHWREYVAHGCGEPRRISASTADVTPPFGPGKGNYKKRWHELKPKIAGPSYADVLIA